MDLSFSSLFSALMVSSLGAALFIYGKKAHSPLPLAAGLCMGFYPYFISSAIVLWGVTVVICAGLFFFRQR